MPDVHVDVSTYQVPVDGSYPHRFLMFRICNEYGRIDSTASVNLARALQLRADPNHSIQNFGGYIIPGFISTDDVLAAIDSISWPRDALLMIDAESWGGQVTGDHSDAWNDMATQMRTRQNGRSDLVWGYGNQNDLDTLWSRRASWLRFTVAGYTDQSNMDFDKYNAIAWQYTNGSENRTNLPSSSPPFGACDHNTVREGSHYPLPGAAPEPEEENDDMLMIYTVNQPGSGADRSQWAFAANYCRHIQNAEEYNALVNSGTAKDCGIINERQRDVMRNAVLHGTGEA
jgi:hypothetical protein